MESSACRTAPAAPVSPGVLNKQCAKEWPAGRGQLSGLAQVERLRERGQGSPGQSRSGGRYREQEQESEQGQVQEQEPEQ